jgi:hypothetical protein
MELVKVEVKRVIGPVRDTAAVLLGNDEKVFMIFVGIYEAAAIIRELQHEKTERPLTHDLIKSVLVGFDIVVKKVIISSIVNNVFCATLVLEREAPGAGDGGATLKDEVRIDLRASDSIVIALKTASEIWVSRKVFEAVEDVKSQLQEHEKTFSGEEEDPESEGGEPEPDEDDGDEEPR